MGPRVRGWRGVCFLNKYFPCSWGVYTGMYHRRCFVPQIFLSFTMTLSPLFFSTEVVPSRDFACRCNWCHYQMIRHYLLEEIIFMNETIDLMKKLLTLSIISPLLKVVILSTRTAYLCGARDATLFCYDNPFITL